MLDWSIYDVYKKITNEQTLMYGVEYQRKVGAWKLRMEQDLIDSVLRGFDIPKFYLDPTESGDDGGPRFYILDGQQRLNTICRFLNNRFALNKNMDFIGNEDLSGKRFKDLPKEFRTKINKTNLHFVNLEGYTESDIEMLFLRLQAGKPLVPAEKRNAVRGDMRDIVCEFSKHKIFDRCDWSGLNKGYSKEDAAAKCLKLIINGKVCDITAKRLMEMYKRNREFDKESKFVKELNKTLNFVYRGFVSNDYYIPGKNLFISLVFATWYLQKEYALVEKSHEFINTYITLDKKRLNDNRLPPEERNPEFERYSRAIRESNRESLFLRHEIITKFLIEKMSLTKKDRYRYLTKDERNIIYSNSGGKCCDCGRPISITEFHSDHIIAHSVGGKTTLDNSQALCSICNLKKSNKIAENNDSEIIDLIEEIPTTFDLTELK